jgi:NAD-dependent dihydropyrimidine dehydrogenase PreA subunit
MLDLQHFITSYYALLIWLILERISPMKRTIITIDPKKCDGCGLCIDACAESAIELVDGKAKLVRENFCDGLGKCLPICPTDAISFEEREAPAFDDLAVATFQQSSVTTAISTPSELRTWPIELKLVSPEASYFNAANLLVAADCSAYACSSFHADYMKDRVTLIGCPKLDNIDYSEKLTAILAGNDVKSLTVTRMEVPCCGGIVEFCKRAIKASGKQIPLRTVTLSIEGNTLADEITEEML